MAYGQENEKRALEAYRKARKDQKVCVCESGFWVNPQYPGLGCSPDGLIMEEGNLVGLLEIKCPYILKDIHPMDIHKLNRQQLSGFCSRIENGTFSLKRNHAYFWQVQMQMAICNVKQCDFVVWSPKGIVVESIPV